MDQVFIRDLLARGILGVYDWESREPRPVLINLTLFTDLHKAGESDAIADCVDYAAAAHKVQST
jgi:FolB domain-containing protein